MVVDPSRCYFFENWWMILKCPLLLKPLAIIVQENSQSFYPSEPFRIIHFTMRHPVYSTFLYLLGILGADITKEPKFLAKLDLKKQTVFLDFNLGGQTLVMLKGLKNGTSIAGNYTL